MTTLVMAWVHSALWPIIAISQESYVLMHTLAEEICVNARLAPAL